MVVVAVVISDARHCCVCRKVIIRKINAQHTVMTTHCCWLWWWTCTLPGHRAMIRDRLATLERVQVAECVWDGETAKYVLVLIAWHCVCASKKAKSQIANSVLTGAKCCLPIDRAASAEASASATDDDHSALNAQSAALKKGEKREKRLPVHLNNITWWCKHRHPQDRSIQSFDSLAVVQTPEPPPPPPPQIIIIIFFNTTVFSLPTTVCLTAKTSTGETSSAEVLNR